MIFVKLEIPFGTVALAFLMLAFGLTPAQGAVSYIGDGAAFGAGQPAGTGARADFIFPLSYLFSNEVVGVSFTAGSAMQITLTSVNLLAQDAGSLTPFVARYNGGSASNAGSYTLLAKGDVLSIPAGSSSGVLFNGQFTVSGVNPTLSLNAGDTIVAGLFQTTSIVVFSFTAQSATNDRIWQTNVTSGVNPGQTLTGGGDGFNFNLTYFYDIGFTQVSQVPEPNSVILMSTMLLAIAFVRRKRIAWGLSPGARTNR